MAKKILNKRARIMEIKMRFAIISDVHGNLPALDKVLEDAKESGVEEYIFVGDYCLNNPYPNECLNRIRKIENKYVIRGNEESYFENLVGKDPSAWNDGQFQITYWVYNSLSKDNIEYLLSLPLCEKINCYGQSISIAHSSSEFIEDCEHSEFKTSKVAERYGDKFITQEMLRVDMHKYLKGSDKFKMVFESLSDGIYIFGHSHIQWSYINEDRTKILINPGSCGLPLDCIENGVPYPFLRRNIFLFMMGQDLL